MKRGEHFAELNLIFKGKVVLSLKKKDLNDYFVLYETCYFGDYQIIHKLRASECYKASYDTEVYVYCIKKRELLDLIETFPESKAIFVDRAT